MPPGGGGLGLETPPLCPLAPMPEAISVGALPALNLLYDPRGVRFGTPHWLVLLQHWAQLGLVRQWRQGKAVAFGVDWATVLAQPRPVYQPRLPALARGLGAPVPRRQGGDHGRDRGQTGGPGGPDGQRGSPCGPCGGP